VAADGVTANGYDAAEHTRKVRAFGYRLVGLSKYNTRIIKQRIIPGTIITFFSICEA